MRFSLSVSTFEPSLALFDLVLFCCSLFSFSLLSLHDPGMFVVDSVFHCLTHVTSLHFGLERTRSCRCTCLSFRVTFFSFLCVSSHFFVSFSQMSSKKPKARTHSQRDPIKSQGLASLLEIAPPPRATKVPRVDSHQAPSIKALFTKASSAVASSSVPSSAVPLSPVQAVHQPPLSPVQAAPKAPSSGPAAPPVIQQQVQPSSQPSSTTPDAAPVPSSGPAATSVPSSAEVKAYPVQQVCICSYHSLVLLRFSLSLFALSSTDNHRRIPDAQVAQLEVPVEPHCRSAL